MKVKHYLPVFLLSLCVIRLLQADEHSDTRQPLKPVSGTSTNWQFGASSDPVPHIGMASAAPQTGSQTQNWEQVLSNYTKAVELHPSAQAYFNRGATYMGASQLDKALADYDESLRLNPTNYYAYMARGDILFRLNQWGKAINDFSQALYYRNDVPYPFYKRGDSYTMMGKFDAAIADFDEALRIKARQDAAYKPGTPFNIIEVLPPAIAIYIDRAAARRKKGDLDGAISDYNKSLELDPRNAGIYKDRATAEKEKGDLGSAYRDLDHALQLDTNYTLAYDAHGDLQLARTNLPGAIADFTKAIQANSNYFVAYYHRAGAWQSMGKMDEALADYNEVIRLTPNDARAHVDRGFIFYDRLAFTNALADFQRAGELVQRNDRVQFRLWLIRARLGKQESASLALLDYADKHKITESKDWSGCIARFLMGQTAEADFLQSTHNETNKAMETAKLCEACFYIGTKRLIAGDKTNAIDYFEKCLATNEKNFVDYKSAAAELSALRPK